MSTFTDPLFWKDGIQELLHIQVIMAPSTSSLEECAIRKTSVLATL
jgi:hypothetical protein